MAPGTSSHMTRTKQLLMVQINLLELGSPAKPSPAPTYKSTHEFVSGTAGKELPQEVKSCFQTINLIWPTVRKLPNAASEGRSWNIWWHMELPVIRTRTKQQVGADVHFIGTWLSQLTQLRLLAVWWTYDNGAGRRPAECSVHLLLADGRIQASA